MSTVNTALGEIGTAEMGFTLCHEHFIISSAGIQQTYPELIGRDRAVSESVERLNEAKAEGVSTVIDLTTMDLGRDVQALKAISEATGVNIIVATGAWLDVSRTFGGFSPDRIADLFVREIEAGIEGTGIKAGVIKVANQDEITPTGEIALRAAARAQLATGVPIFTHTNAHVLIGNKQVEIFEDEGVDLSRVSIGHSNDSTDLGYLTGLLKKGVYLGLDRYPSQQPSWEERTDVLMRLINGGYGDRLLLGHDVATLIAFIPEDAWQERHRENPHRYSFISRKVLPRLRELGATEDQIDDLMVNNPRRYFGG